MTRPGTASLVGRRCVAAGSALAWLLTAHSAYNLRRLRTPADRPPPAAEPLSVLVPARDEAAQIGACLDAVLASTGLHDVEVLVLDDCSSDATGDIVRAYTKRDPRVRLLDGAPPPPGWLGKPWACAQLAAAARGRVLIFVDADVRLVPHAVAATAALLRGCGAGRRDGPAGSFDVVSPYPRQLAGTPAERLVQPLLAWSWLTTLPLGPAERSPRPSLSAANGQLLALDADAYAAIGGHGAVRDAVLDDLALVRAVKRSGRRALVADGSQIAACRMYDGWAELRAGYTKSLWSAFGSPAAAAAVVGGLSLAYVVPPLSALRGSSVGLLGYAAGVAGRVLTGRRVGARVWPDALAHPISVLLFGWLTGASYVGRRRGTLVWKGRRVG